MVVSHTEKYCIAMILEELETSTYIILTIIILRSHTNCRKSNYENLKNMQSNILYYLMINVYKYNNIKRCSITVIS